MKLEGFSYENSKGDLSPPEKMEIEEVASEGDDDVVFAEEQPEDTPNSNGAHH